MVCSTIITPPPRPLVWLRNTACDASSLVSAAGTPGKAWWSLGNVWGCPGEDDGAGSKEQAGQGVLVCLGQDQGRLLLGSGRRSYCIFIKGRCALLRGFRFPGMFVRACSKGLTLPRKARLGPGVVELLLGLLTHRNHKQSCLPLVPISRSLATWFKHFGSLVRLN